MKPSPSPSRQQGSIAPQSLWRMTPMSRDKADTLLLIAACMLVLLPHAFNVDWWVSASCTALLIWRAWLTLTGRRLPKPIVLLPISGLLMVGVYLSFHTFFGREVGITMLALLLTCKLLEMHAKRDLFVVLYLSFFLLLTSFLSSQSIFTAVLSLFAVCTLLTAQLSFQYTGLVPSLGQRFKLGAMILGLAIPLTIVAFFLFPRIQGPLWGMPGDANKGKTGLSEVMTPGNISDLAKSEEIAFRVKFLNLPANTSPPKSTLYWRGIVLTNFDGRTWEKELVSRPESTIIAPSNDQDFVQEIVMEPVGQRWLLALDTPYTAPKIDNEDSRLTMSRELRSPKPIVSRLRYEVSSRFNSPLQPDADSRMLRSALELPAGFNPKTLAFAAQLRNSSNDDAVLIQKILQLFRQENFEYTLEPPLLGVNSVDDFLFSTRSGFCEHYASAFVVLMRAMHIPARVVTGYQGGEINNIDGYLAVRQSDAHAWAEVWLKDRGWVRIDPTAAVAPNRVSLDLRATQPKGAFAGFVSLALGSGSMWANLRMRWDAINNSWNQWVLNYNQTKQLDFMRSLGFKDINWSELTLALFVIAAAVMGLIALPLLRNQTKMSALDKLYFSFCKKLERQAPPRALHEGPASYRQRLRGLLPAPQYAPIHEFLTLYEQAKYGRPHTNDGKLLAQLKALLAQCR